MGDEAQPVVNAPETPISSATIPSAVGTPESVKPEAPAAPSFNLKELIPQEYASKPYLKDILDRNDFIGLVKKLDGAESLIGKRPTGIPDFSKATPEEINKFYQTLGKPEKADDYEVKAEGIDEQAAAQLKAVFHSANLSKAQAKAVLEGVSKLGNESLEVQAEREKQLDVQFDELVQKTFGERQAKVLELTNSITSKYLTPELRKVFEGAPNEALVSIMAIVDGMTKDYVNEDSLTQNVKGNSTNASSMPDIRAERVKLYMEDAFKDPTHRDHERILARLAELNSMEARLAK